MDSPELIMSRGAAEVADKRRCPGREWIALAAAVVASGVSLGVVWLAAAWIQRLPASAAPAAETNAIPPALIAQGNTDFQMSCSHCHAADAHGDEGPDLHGLTISDGRIATTIQHGVKGEMPSFAKKYGEPDVKALIAFLRSLSPDRTAGS
jgi:mono/diheme cytochrome c family protein